LLSLFLFSLIGCGFNVLYYFFIRCGIFYFFSFLASGEGCRSLLKISNGSRHNKKRGKLRRERDKQHIESP
jgi:hypothetical protein